MRAQASGRGRSCSRTRSFPCSALARCARRARSLRGARVAWPLHQDPAIRKGQNIRMQSTAGPHRGDAAPVKARQANIGSYYVLACWGRPTHGWCWRGANRQAHLLQRVHGSFHVENGHAFFGAASRPPTRVELHAGVSERGQGSTARAMSCVNQFGSKQHHQTPVPTTGTTPDDSKLSK
jgi:hypothetical protein